MSVLSIRPVTTASSLAESLREELLSGEYPPGTPLGDADLVERAGVSAATARAALSELEHDGLVVHSLHRGVEVVRITPDDVRDIYAALVSSEPLPSTATDAARSFEIVTAIYSSAASGATVTPDTLRSDVDRRRSLESPVTDLRHA